jgi:hypothetical protein
MTIGIPKGAEWRGPPLDHIEARQHLAGQKIDNAIVVIRQGFHAECCVFNNVVFVCEDKVSADQVAKFVSPGRVVIGGMAAAIELLSIASGEGGE